MPPTIERKELTPEEKAEQEKILERRERFRRAYEKRVESGKQKEYYERTKYKKREKYNADKAALFEDGYTLGATVLETGARDKTSPSAEQSATQQTAV